MKKNIRKSLSITATQNHWIYEKLFTTGGRGQWFTLCCSASRMTPSPSSVFSLSNFYPPLIRNVVELISKIFPSRFNRFEQKDRQTQFVIAILTVNSRTIVVKIMMLPKNFAEVSFFFNFICLESMSFCMERFCPL